MKNAIRFAVLLLVLGAATIAWAQDDERGVGFGFRFNADVDFVDLHQFGHDLETAGVNDFTPAPPWSGEWSLFVDSLNAQNVLRLGGTFGSLLMEQHHQGSYVGLHDTHAALLVGYKRLFSAPLGLAAEVHLGGGEWQYDLHSRARQGRAYEEYWYVEPQLGFELLFGVLGVGVYGSYWTQAIDSGALFSGDLDAQHYRGLNLDHFSVKLAFLFGAWMTHKRPDAAPAPTTPPAATP
jgi:hypothetical protein